MARPINSVCLLIGVISAFSSCPNSFVNCDELLESVDKSNLNKLVDNRQSELHTRSVLPDNVENESDSSVFSGTAIEMILPQLVSAIKEIASKKCREDFEFAINGLRQDERWALESK